MHVEIKDLTKHPLQTCISIPRPSEPPYISSVLSSDLSKGGFAEGLSRLREPMMSTNLPGPKS